jgi:hypothetical protein
MGTRARAENKLEKYVILYVHTAQFVHQARVKLFYGELLNNRVFTFRTGFHVGRGLPRTCRGTQCLIKLNEQNKLQNTKHWGWVPLNRVEKMFKESVSVNDTDYE